MMTLARQIGKNFYNDIVPKIGLEVHAQLDIKSKLFSRAANSSTSPPNTQLDLLDISLPGSLPTFNRNAVRQAILTSLGLNCAPQSTIHFDRKNYFYPDMPAGYQITQYSKPIARDGYLDFIVSTYQTSLIAHDRNYDMFRSIFAEDRQKYEEFEPYMKRSHIKQIQLEQDSAKTLQQISSDDEQSEQYSLIDYNRSGAALIEIVFEPDLVNHHEASSSIKELVFILKSLGTCDCEFQEGSLRVDANISISSIANHEVRNSARVELKNLNSLKSLNRGISYEIKRQADIIKSGKTVVQETRTYNTKDGETVPLRLKEEAVDYRYVPEPSIPPLQLDQQMIEKIKDEVPSNLPRNVRENLTEKHNLNFRLIAALMEEPGLDEYFLSIMSDRPSYDADTVADFLVYTVGNLKDAMRPHVMIDLEEGGIFRSRMSRKKMQDLLDMVFRDEINFTIALNVVKHVVNNNEPEQVKSIVDKFGWYQINDEKLIEDICSEAVAKMKNISKQYRRKGEKRHLRMMVEKLCELTANKINVGKAITCLNTMLKPNK